MSLAAEQSEIAEKIKELCIAGLLDDGSLHKQWFLEQILRVVGFDLAKLRGEMRAAGYEWTDSIIP
jgi:hypothetical protein